MKKFSVLMDGYDNCCCNICFRIGKVAKIKYYTQNYGSNKRKGKICKNLQKHPHSIWICEKCMKDFRSEWNRATRCLGFEYPKYYGEPLEPLPDIAVTQWMPLPEPPKEEEEE